ncbi:MAG: hypothetical protein NTZ36_01495 [Candidatus Jorgensenbacteria bacterium]|nr:hypothetical protein [Candidatus Jorgensenbacteria bacterium]
MTSEKFNPTNPEYKKVADLPVEYQQEFSDIQEDYGGGFARKSAEVAIIGARLKSIVEKDPSILQRKIDELHGEAIKIDQKRDGILSAVELAELTNRVLASSPTGDILFFDSASDAVLANIIKEAYEMGHGTPPKSSKTEVCSTEEIISSQSEGVQ